jgi:phosphoribosylanthranilate isomerase
MWLAADAGADAIGVLVGQVHCSGDFIDAKLAAEICNALPPFMSSVLVTHLEDPGEIIALAKAVPTSTVQLHSDLQRTTIGMLRTMLSPRTIIGKVSIDGEESIHRARSLKGSVDAIVLDSIDRSQDKVGGTGIAHDWNLSAAIARTCDIPVILAGGLNPDNVQRAITIVRPWAVDVNSGVEGPHRLKDRARLHAFVTSAKAIGGEL